MTIDEAIADRDRPLSMPPAEWAQYVEASEEEERELVDGEAARLSGQADGVDGPAAVSPGDKLEMGLEQMLLGCKMAIRALQELSREDAAQADRALYDRIGDVVYNAIGPYLVDALRAHGELTSGGGGDGRKA